MENTQKIMRVFSRLSQFGEVVSNGRACGPIVFSTLGFLIDQAMSVPNSQSFLSLSLGECKNSIKTMAPIEPFS